MSNNTYRGVEVNREYVMDIITEFENNPKFDINNGKLDAGWVNFVKLKIDTVMKLYSLDKSELNISIDMDI